MVRQTSRGKSAAAAPTAGLPWPLNSQGMSAWSYRVTTNHSFIQYKQTSVVITKVALWNDKTFDFTNTCLPASSWWCQPSQQLDKVSEGLRYDHFLNTPRSLPNLQLRPIIYMELFDRNMQQINLKTNKYSIDDPRSPRRGSRSGPRVFHETIMVLSLWRHSGCPWDNEVSLATHQWPMVFCQTEFNICVRCDMAFIEPMHCNKLNITYLLTYQLASIPCYVYLKIWYWKSRVEVSVCSGVGYC